MTQVVKYTMKVKVIKYFLQIFVIWNNGAGKKWGARYTFWYIVLLTLCNGDRRIVQWGTVLRIPSFPGAMPHKWDWLIWAGAGTCRNKQGWNVIESRPLQLGGQLEARDKFGGNLTDHLPSMGGEYHSSSPYHSYHHRQKNNYNTRKYDTDTYRNIIINDNNNFSGDLVIHCPPSSPPMSLAALLPKIR